MRAESDPSPDIRGRDHSRALDAEIAEVAGAQFGVVARWQLLSVGASRRAIEHRIATGRLHRLHDGVYAVGHAVVSLHGRWLAGVLAAGSGATLTHRAAAALLGVRASRLVEVTAPRQRTIAGVITHRGAVAEDELTMDGPIPVTTVARTLIDLAAVVPARQLARAVREAETKRLGGELPLAELVDRHRGRRGMAALRAVLESGRVVLATRSELEERFLDLIDRAGLPRPVVNALVEGFECDCVWPQQRVIVELDGHAFHSTRAAYERDRRRDRALSAAGWRVIRVTWSELHSARAALLRDLRALLRLP